MRLNRLISKRSPIDEVEPVSLDTAAMPPDHRAYVIGDIHGRNDLLRLLLDRISADMAKKKKVKTDLVFLGDYVDRGQDSRGVIETILKLDLPGVNIVTLKGNHEESMLCFLSEPVKGKRWLHYGGDSTLRSYDVEITPGTATEVNIKTAAKKFKKLIPDTHRQFLKDLDDRYIAGDYFFVHAGIDPGESLDNQAAHDLLWIRDEFLLHDGLYEKVIVHGHSIIPEPEFKQNRIAIDTGAFYSNTLTCLVLEGKDKEIL